jgi:hypothetical protein
MIISQSRRFVFVHVHKTAGESITRALAPHLGRGDIVLGGTFRGNLANVWYRRRHGLSKHSSAMVIRDFMGAQAWQDSFRFSVVRNPYDRILSFYHYLETMIGRRRREGMMMRLLDRLPGMEVRDPLHWPESAAFLETETFSDYIRHPAFGPHAFGTRPQIAVLGDETGRSMVETVIRFETLAADFAKVAERIGLPGLRLGWHNASSRSRDATRRLAPADRALLFDLYRADFEAFGYPREEG